MSPSLSWTPGQEEVAKREFAKEGLVLNFVSGSRYLGAYLGPQAELEAWVKTQVEAWAHGFKVLAKIAQRHPQSAYAGLGCCRNRSGSAYKGLSPE